MIKQKNTTIQEEAVMNYYQFYFNYNKRDI